MFPKSHEKAYLHKPTCQPLTFALTFALLLQVGVLSLGDLAHLGLDVFDLVLKFLSEKHHLALVGGVKHVVIGLVCLVELKQTAHLPDQRLRCLEMCLFSFVLHQPRLVHI